MKASTRTPGLLILFALIPANWESHKLCKESSIIIQETKQDGDLQLGKQVKNATEKGIAYLLKNQNKNGSWSKGKQGDSAAVTSLACLALIAWPDIEKERSSKALDEGTKFVINALTRGAPDDKNLSKVAAFYWDSSYAIVFLSKAYQKSKNAQIEEAIKKGLQFFQEKQLQNGGWAYNPKKGLTYTFVTAIVIDALLEVKKCGMAVDEEMFKKGVLALKSERKSNGTFPYKGGHHANEEIIERKISNYKDYKLDSEGIGDSAGRTILGELILHLVKEISQEDLQKACELFLKHRDRLEEVLKKTKPGEDPDNPGKGKLPHLPPYGAATYYYFFGHYYAGKAISNLSGEPKKLMMSKLHEVILRDQDKEGFWVDSEKSAGKNCGTAMALLILKETAK